MPTNQLGYMRVYMAGYVLRQPIIECQVCGKSYKKHKKGMHERTKFHRNCDEIMKKKQAEIEKNQDLEELKRRLNNLEQMMNERK
jgi:hypothetical protein